MKRLFLTLAASAAIFAGAASDDHLIILHTNDTHSQIDPDFDGKGGILRRKAAIDSIRRHNQNVMLVDAGDAVQGTLYFSLFKGEVESKMMNALGYDLCILGNHEFDNSLDSIFPFYKNIEAKLIASNYDLSNTAMRNIANQYAMREFGGRKIAFIAAGVNPDGLVQPENVSGAIWLDPMNRLDSIAGVLKSRHGAEMVVMISHLGYYHNDADKRNDVSIARTSRNIDIIIGGHSHTLINPESDNDDKYLIENAEGKKVLIAQSGSQGKYLGVVDIDLEDLTAESSVIKIDSKFDSKTDPTVAHRLLPYKVKVDSLMNLKIAESAKTMINRRGRELSHWVADVAMIMAPRLFNEEVDCAIMNSGGIRRSMPEGDVSEGLISAMFPFENYYEIIEINGKELIEVLQVMASRNDNAVSKELNVCVDKNNKVLKATLNGKKINEKKNYRIITIDYLRKGGDGMKMFITKPVLARDDAKMGEKMLEYVRELGKKGIKIDSDNTPRIHRK